MVVVWILLKNLFPNSAPKISNTNILYGINVISDRNFCGIILIGKTNCLYDVEFTCNFIQVNYIWDFSDNDVLYVNLSEINDLHM